MSERHDRDPIEPRRITPRTTLENLKKEAKRWLTAIDDGDADARARFARALPQVSASPTLRDVQLALAREHGLPGWQALVDRLTRDAALRRYERAADALVTAYHADDDEARRIVWDYFGHMRAWDALRRYVRLDLGRTERPEPAELDRITLADAQYLVARAQGFESWDALATFARSVSPEKTLAVKAVTVSSSADEAPATAVVVRSRDWDEILEVLEDEAQPALDASGQMTDALLEQVSRIEHIAALDLHASKALTDDGLRWLGRLPRLRRLNVSGTAVTDRGLEVLRRLPALESIALAWTDVSDAGAAHLAACDALQRVDLSGTACGDGALRALAGKRALFDLRSGNGVTDAGLPLLHELPVFKTWQGGEARMRLLSPDARPNLLLLRGSLTNAGMTQLVGLDGLFALNVDSDRLALTGAGLAPLTALPHLGWLAFDAKDESMPHIAALPHLRFLLCQDTTAGDDGFVALSRSQTIEHIWGRRCYGLQRRGFTALADMPALRSLSVSCRNVDDEGVSALPRFPALRELMPMDIPDEGYRHIARCPRLESLILMYCRDTTDASTEHIAGLPGLTKYFASYNRITDRTPQLLSGMASLEDVTFDSCAGLTDAGIAHLARLPRLRELRVESMPGVTAGITAAFGPSVRVRHST